MKVSNSGGAVYGTRRRDGVWCVKNKKVHREREEAEKVSFGVQVNLRIRWSCLHGREQQLRRSTCGPSQSCSTSVVNLRAAARVQFSDALQYAGVKVATLESPKMQLECHSGMSL